jgi:hypothetical protein
LKVLKYAHEHGCPWDEWTCVEAAGKGHLEMGSTNVRMGCWTWTFGSTHHEQGCPWDKVTCDNAVEYGLLKVLIYAHENECPWGELTCAKAANGMMG